MHKSIETNQSTLDTQESNPENQVHTEKRSLLLKALALYLIVVISGLLTSAIVGGYLIADIWSNAKSILTTGQMTNSFSTETMVNTALNDIKLLRENQLIEIFEQKCFVISAFSKYIDPEIYNEYPERKIELIKLLEESDKALNLLIEGGVCSRENLSYN